MDSGPGGAGSAVNGPKEQGRAAALVRGQAEAGMGCRPQRGPRAACPGPRPVSGSHCPGELGRLGQVGHGWGPAAPPAGSRTPTRAARPTRQVKCCPRQAGPALGAPGARTGSRTRSWTAPHLPDEPDPGHSPHMHLGPGARGGAGAEGPPPSTQAGPLTRSRNHCSAVRHGLSLWEEERKGPRHRGRAPTREAQAESRPRLVCHLPRLTPATDGTPARSLGTAGLPGPRRPQGTAGDRGPPPLP